MYRYNGFSKNRLTQFIADITQTNDKNEYAEIIAYLKEKVDIDFPEIEV